MPGPRPSRPCGWAVAPFGPDEHVQTGIGDAETTRQARSCRTTQGNHQQLLGGSTSRSRPGSSGWSARSRGRATRPYCLQDGCQIGLELPGAHDPGLPARQGSRRTRCRRDLATTAASTWWTRSRASGTGVIFGDVASDGGTNGAVPWRVAHRARPSGSARCLRRTRCWRLARAAPSRSARPRARPRRATADGVDRRAVPLPRDPTSIPVTLRSLVNVGAGGVSSAACVNGGNGRSPGRGPGGATTSSTSRPGKKGHHPRT